MIVQSLDKQTPKLFTEFFYHSVNNERPVRDSTKSKLEARRRLEKNCISG